MGKNAIILITITSLVFCSYFLYWAFRYKSNQTESMFEKKLICFSKWDEFKKGMKFKETYQQVFYSPILDTCIAELKFGQNILSNSTDWNYISKWFIDILTNKDLWWISYWDKWFFESTWYLPNICNKKYITDNSSETKNVTVWTAEVDLVKKIYSIEFMYENCLSYLKWKWTINIKIDNFSPELINDYINYLDS